MVKNCIYCGQTINEDAKQCPSCKEYFILPKHKGVKSDIKQTDVKEVVEVDVVSTDSKFSFRLMMLEVLGLLLFLWSKQQWEWWVPLVLFVLIWIVLQMQYMRMLYVFGISIAWTYGCFVFLFEDKNIRHSWLLILVFLVSVLIHYPAVKRRKVMREVER
ncbi:MAG: hypothetical protein LBE34_02320 [Flavobacteriaceae bacterium]|jgi:hypothetical protein|nr:hypothetical protein [Flavobacteriaceae bacterium]